MKTLLTALLLVAASALAMASVKAPPIPRVSATCPAGYHRSGGYCLPTTAKAAPALPRSGATCPPGYYRNGAYCLKLK